MTPFAEAPDFVVALGGTPMAAHVAWDEAIEAAIRRRIDEVPTHRSPQSRVKFEKGRSTAALRAIGGARMGYAICGGKEYDDADGRMSKLCLQIAVPMAVLGSVQCNGAGDGVMRIFAEAGRKAMNAVSREGYNWWCVPDVFGIPLDLDGEPMNEFIGKSCYPIPDLLDRGKMLLGFLEHMVGGVHMPFNGDGSHLELWTSINLLKPGIIRETISPFTVEARPVQLMLDFSDSKYWAPVIDTFRAMAKGRGNGSDDGRQARKDAELKERESWWIMGDNRDHVWEAVLMMDRVAASHFGDSPIKVWEKVNRRDFRKECERLLSDLGAGA